MDTNQRHTFTELAAGAIHRVADGAGTTIAVVRGRVWITQESDPSDRVIDAGESFRLDRPGLALVQALADASLLILDSASGAAERFGGPDRSASERRFSAWELEAVARRAHSDMVADAIAGLYRWASQLSRRVWRRLRRRLERGVGFGAWRATAHRG